MPNVRLLRGQRSSSEQDDATYNGELMKEELEVYLLISVAAAACALAAAIIAMSYLWVML